MKSSQKRENPAELATRTVDFLVSAKGRAALRRASAEAKKAAEPFRRMRNISQQQLNRIFTI